MSFDVYELCGDGMIWPRGLMDKASDFESEDCGFDPHRGHFPQFRTVQMTPGLLQPPPPPRYRVIESIPLLVQWQNSSLPSGDPGLML